MKFEDLIKVNVNEYTEQKNGLNYLSWTYAWTEIKKQCPDADYEILKFENNLPYVYDENTGYMVFTKVTILNKTYEMWLPVMDGNNKAMLNHTYTYKVKEYAKGEFTGNYIEKEVQPATMFDINKTIMRCLVKNIAMFGLGLYIYAGEDMPDGYEMTKEEAENILITFGKYNGKTLKEIKEINPSYLNYLIDYDGSKESLKTACSLLLTKNTEKSLEELNLLTDLEKIIIECSIDRETIYQKYKVNSLSDLNEKQLNEAINTIREWKQKKEGKC